MLTITTTNNLDGYEVVEYLGIVTGEAVSGINMFRDIGAGLRNVFGGRSEGYEDEMAQAREEVLREMSQRAEALGANAVIGANVGYETFAEMIMTPLAAPQCACAERHNRHARSCALPLLVETGTQSAVISIAHEHAERPRSPSHIKTRTIQNRHRPDDPGCKVRDAGQIRARENAAQGKSEHRAKRRAGQHPSPGMSMWNDLPVGQLKPACPGSGRTCAG